ncbi:hypothetical protein AVEN_38854-1 [Araneus ventricosus]|uniref:Uncharacterized protein n=1 Tax=Araneus ventricosus TaxID=182803 RepID=A0A4Y2SYW9_ARAVE|nr:hypothetical protein AVEN_38854-1 [Araneus ventricosus]
MWIAIPPVPDILFVHITTDIKIALSEKRIELPKPETFSCIFSAHSQNSTLQSGSSSVRCCNICFLYGYHLLVCKFRMTAKTPDPLRRTAGHLC